MREALRVASTAIDMGALQDAIGPLCWRAGRPSSGRLQGDCAFFEVLSAESTVRSGPIYGVERMLERHQPTALLTSTASIAAQSPANARRHAHPHAARPSPRPHPQPIAA